MAYGFIDIVHPEVLIHDLVAAEDDAPSISVTLSLVDIGAMRGPVLWNDGLVRTLRVIKGDSTVPQASGAKIIAHICNDLGGWGKGFVLAISRRRPQPERDHRRRHRDRAGNDFGLGAVQLVQVRPDIWVADMVAQHGIRAGSAGPPIRYEAVGQCLATVAGHALRLGASVHLPRIGCGLAGGRWERVEPLIVDALRARDVPTTVYDHD